MKFGHALIITVVLGFFALSAHSEEYKAPKLHFKSSHKAKDYSVAKEKDFKEFGENTYRVQENDYSERNLASEVQPEPEVKHEEGRNPSSQVGPEEEGPQQPKTSPEPKAKPWNYNHK